MTGVSKPEKLNRKTHRDNVNNWIPRREDISNCNRVRALHMTLTLAFYRPKYEIAGCLEILVRMSIEHAIPPP